ncbi:MAG: ThuA domain-containing protein, partial [Bacteroidales bacterium]|nr:ThuA domain-containing protein [Bacteroidales bacterium]
MKKQFVYLLLTASLLSISGTYTKAENTYKALIVTGQNNHKWQESHPILKKILEQTKLFTADIIITPAQGGDMTTFNPQFSNYDLVVLDYNGDSWNSETNSAFLEFVRNGGGVVIYHAADNAFPEWEEYNKIIGLGGWGGRNEKSGPYVYYRDDSIVRDDTSKGIGGTHGPRNDYLVRTRIFDHPITKGLPANWMHANDELYALLRGPAENMEILATANSAQTGAVPPGSKQQPATTKPVSPSAPTGTDPGFGTKKPFPARQPQPARDEPVLMTIKYGKGRIFHTVLG